ncbi:hypothetical protein [Altererythrobacter sp. C41]|uniref:hypothetical protein n=1 Tax=Altererythrobacter sp. C41 TaxID=2806021 RepID=UPI001932D993|nr:hypothetical protein [Altererythrobacter sp. C41]MBM0169671.1 hypothetical protein [Altererythrobacter sp. C41]
MNKFYETLTNLRGDVLFGYRVQVVDETGASVDIYRDRSGTRFTDASGNIVNYAEASSDTGMAEFYWNAATGHILQITDSSGELARPPIIGFGDNYVLGNLSGDLPTTAIDGLDDTLAAKADTTYVDTNLATKVPTADLASTDTGKGAALVGMPQGGTVAGVRASKIALLNTTGLQAMAASLDADRLSSGYIPTWNADVEITDPIIFEQPGTRIYGDFGATYDRGGGKLGWLTGATGLTRIMDLGNSRIAGDNPADTWTVEHLGFKPADITNDLREIDGIAFTSRTNGPDRGIGIRSCAFIGLKDAITIENTDISVTAGTMNIEGCVFTRNASAVHAKGRVFGFRFVGNECEQNAGGTGGEGVIRGCFDGPVTIDGNMLEGQPNAISLDIFAMTGSSPTFSSRGNYFEANTGDYVYRFRANAPWVCEIGPNYTQAITATDYLLIEGCSSYGKLVMRDNFPVMFDNSPCTLAYGSDILCRQQRAYSIRTIPSKSAEIVISDWFGLTDDDGDHTHVWAPSVYSEVATPYGPRFAAPEGSFITVPVSVAVGDLVSLNILMRAEEVVAGNLSFQAYDSTATNIIRSWGSSNVAKVLAGKWALVNVAFVANYASSSIRVRFDASSGTYDIAMAAVAAKNMGAYANDGAVTASIKPVAPTPEDVPGSLSGSHAYGGITLADGAGANVIATLTGAVLGDFVTALCYSQNLQNLTVTAAVRAADSVGIRIQNETGAEVTLAAGTFYYEGKKR